MTNQTSENLNLEQLLNKAKLQLEATSTNENSLKEAAFEFSTFADVANQASLEGLFQGADMLSRILELAACWCSQFQDDPDLVDELIEFVNQSWPALENAIIDPATTSEVHAFVELAREKWSDYLSLLDDGLQESSWEDSRHESDESALISPESELESVGEAQIELLLSALSNTVEEQTDSDRGGISDAAAKLELTNDREMLEAYLDDALRCLSSMEQAALAFEASQQDQEPIEQFCRELHTLKGASATVGLSELASFLHDLETSLETMFDGEPNDVTADPLFDAVDRVRAEIGSLQQTDSEPADTQLVDANGDRDPKSVQVRKEVASYSVSDDASIRIRAAKLDRLMDMLAELVVLRNRRESHVAEFNSFNEELARCASRLNFAEEQSQFDVEMESANANPFVRNSSCTFSEVAKDISAVSKGMRELQKPVSHDNAAISRFIRDFRQELMQLRRIPVVGLFNRLQRAARDAAKSEKKQVQIKVVGEQAGLEQEIQERLFESLLHVVRNSVSHGIESAEQRVNAGKNRVGTVTLEASSSAQLLVIEVRDDGNGLNHEAIRRRAFEKGLLSPNQRPTNEELARLIFHPGFSTREQASAVSGRGVGMDIVTRTIEQLQGRVDVESVSGQGTTIRLSIPLRTGIEHVMVFRTEGQLFALPMQSVTAAKSSNSNIAEVAKLSLSTSLSQNSENQAGSEDVLLLRGAREVNGHGENVATEKTQVALAVDELVGPEEVVVRGLPNLLRNHPLFCGVTLSGSGEKVLLLDSERVLEFCQHHTNDAGGEYEVGKNASEKFSNKKRALVVDDSLTARKVLVKLLQHHGFVTVEAGDGIEAIERLHKEQFDLVLTDLDMPRFGGLELLADIQSSRYCDAPVVVVSSRNEEAFRTKAMDVGATDYVTKPVSELSITHLLDGLQLLPETSKG